MIIVWTHKSLPVTDVSDMPENVHGFVYCIKTNDGRKYIGKKTLFSNRKRKFGKKESSLITDKRKKLWEIVRKESDWEAYNGSNSELNEVINSGMEYSKEILHYAFHKKQLSYLENRELYEQRVLEQPDVYYNSNIGGSFFRKDT
jgi:hypothetical protein